MSQKARLLPADKPWSPTTLDRASFLFVAVESQSTRPTSLQLSSPWRRRCMTTLAIEDMLICRPSHVWMFITHVRAADCALDCKMQNNESFVSVWWTRKSSHQKRRWSSLLFTCVNTQCPYSALTVPLQFPYGNYHSALIFYVIKKGLPTPPSFKQ